MEKQAIPSGKAQSELNRYSFAGANLPFRSAMQLLSLQGKIDPADLGDDGRELHPHITVKYGIKSDDVDELRKVLAGVPPIRAKLGKASLFKNPEHDVLKLDVDSPDLARVHQLISERFENDDTYPEYHPHATIAYLKPGMGQKYLNLNQMAGNEVLFNSIMFRDREGRKHRVQLGLPMNKAAFTKAFLAGYLAKEAGDSDAYDPNANLGPLEQRMWDIYTGARGKYPFSTRAQKSFPNQDYDKGMSAPEIIALGGKMGVKKLQINEAASGPSSYDVEDDAMSVVPGPGVRGTMYHEFAHKSDPSFQELLKTLDILRPYKVGTKHVWRWNADRFEKAHPAESYLDRARARWEFPAMLVQEAAHQQLGGVPADTTFRQNLQKYIPLTGGSGDIERIRNFMKSIRKVPGATYNTKDPYQYGGVPPLVRQAGNMGKAYEAYLEHLRRRVTRPKNSDEVPVISSSPKQTIVGK